MTNQENSETFEEFKDDLQSAGWTSPNDAQHENIKVVFAKYFYKQQKIIELLKKSNEFCTLAIESSLKENEKLDRDYGDSVTLQSVECELCQNNALELARETGKQVKELEDE